jgi:hypothetical protein
MQSEQPADIIEARDTGGAAADAPRPQQVTSIVHRRNHARMDRGRGFLFWIQRKPYSALASASTGSPSLHAWRSVKTLVSTFSKATSRPTRKLRIVLDEASGRTRDQGTTTHNAIYASVRSSGMVAGPADASYALRHTPPKLYRP